MLVRDPNGNFSQQIGNSQDYFVVFLDPESEIYYRMYLNNPSFIQLEQMTDPQVQKRNKITLRNIKSLLDLPGFHWDFREADFYRRR